MGCCSSTSSRGGGPRRHRQARVGSKGRSPDSQGSSSEGWPERRLAKDEVTVDPLNDIVSKYRATGKLTPQDVQALFQANLQFPRTANAYETVCRIMLHRGEPLLACDTLDSATKTYPTSVALKQLLGLALAQAGCTHRAMAVLEDLRAGGDKSEETSGVLARCYKDLAASVDELAERRRHYSKAYHVYRDAYVRGGKKSYYTGINAATMALLLDNAEEANRVADEVKALCLAELAASPRNAEQDIVNERAYWLNATLGEVSVIQGRMQQAMSYFTRATDGCPRAYGKFSSTLRQIRLLLRHRRATSGTFNRRESTVMSLKASMDGYIAAVVQEARHTLQVAHLESKHDATPDIITSDQPPTPHDEPTPLHALPRTAPGGSASGLTPSSAITADFLRTRAQLACARVVEGIEVKKALDDRLAKLIAFEITEALPDTDGVAERLGWADVNDTVAHAALHVAATRFTAMPLSETDRFSQVNFQHVFKLPSVIAILSALTHEDVVTTGSSEAVLRRRFAAVLEKTGSGFAFGSPCTLPDILFLEEVHRAGGDVWLVLPAPVDVHEEFLRQRFTKLARAQSVSHAPAGTSGGGGDDNSVLAHVSVGFDSMPNVLDSPMPAVDALIRRFRRLVSVATKVDVSNTMTPEITSANLHYCGMVLYGLAKMKATKLGVPLERVFLKPEPDTAPQPSSVTPSGEQSDTRRSSQLVRHSSACSPHERATIGGNSFRGRAQDGSSSFRGRAQDGISSSSGSSSFRGQRLDSNSFRARMQERGSVRDGDSHGQTRPRTRSHPARLSFSNLRVSTALDTQPASSSVRRMRNRSFADAGIEGTPRSLLTPSEVSTFGTPRGDVSTPSFFDRGGQHAGEERKTDTTHGSVPLSPKPAPSPRSTRSWFVTPSMVDLWEENDMAFRVLFFPAVHVPTTMSEKGTPNGDVVASPPRSGIVRVASDGLMLPHKDTPQVITAILFADIVGYSKLSERQVLSFVENFLGSVSELIAACDLPAQPVVKNTWGDAFYFVFTRLLDAGAFALQFSQLVLSTDWTQFGLPASLNIRISLHAAPVFVVTDPITAIRNYTGVHTSMAARIEPITPAGNVYCSQAFAAICQALKPPDMECTYVGNVPLAKSYGLQKVYQLHRVRHHH